MYSHRAKLGEVGTYPMLKYTLVRTPGRWWHPSSVTHLFKQLPYFYLITYYTQMCALVQTLVFPIKFQGLKIFFKTFKVP